MPLTIDRVRRMGGAAGIVFAILAVVSLFLPGTPPKADEVGKITSYFLDKRGGILASDYVLGAAFAFFLLFLGSLRAHFGAAGRDGVRPGSAILAAGAAGAALVFAGTGVLNAAVFQVSLSPAVNHALYNVANDLFFMSGFAFAAFFTAAAVAVAGTESMPGAFCPAAVLVAVLNLVSPIGLFAKSGFFAIGGAFGFIVPLASLLWVVAASVVLLRPASPAQAAPSRQAPA
jgi:hypothetical protein